MGIELVWQEENGKELARLSDPSSLLGKFLPDESDFGFVCLRFVDPYGDTIFNTLQIPVVLQELQARLAIPLSPLVEEHLRKAIALVENAENHIHTYLRFIGD
ncbi:hypothetical protein [Leptothrix ochracea]|uniref:hypothetical protein n=1 Tax=Leptothrix ochracea TaxID=735331 RepID=UPI0034E1B2E1